MGFRSLPLNACSSQSASGRFPLESVVMQQRIINRVEDSPRYLREIQARPRAAQAQPFEPLRVCVGVGGVSATI
jgi:pyruvate kinase